MVPILFLFALNVLITGKASNEINDNGISSGINYGFSHNVIIFPGLKPNIIESNIVRKRRSGNGNGYWNQAAKRARYQRRQQRNQQQRYNKRNQYRQGNGNRYGNRGYGYGRRYAAAGDIEHKSQSQQTMYTGNLNTNGGYNSARRSLGGWTPWTVWTTCSRTCAYGSQTRRRFCANARLGSNNCPGQSTQSQVCGSGETCLPLFQWSSWNEWTECTQSCGSGTTYRSRRCYNTGTNMAADSDKSCKGANTEQNQCNIHSCAPTEDNPTALKMTGMCGTIPMKEKFESAVGTTVQKSPVNLRITGGHVAKMGDFPWQVSLQRRTCKKNLRPGYNFKEQCTWKHMCGAAILHSKWVITAAHCIAESGYQTNYERPGEDWALVIGMDKLNDGGTGTDGKRHYIEKIVQHPDYEFQYITVSDVSLLKLKDEITINDRAQPICLPNGVEPEPHEMCQISGWGYGDHAGKGSEVLSTDLRQASIPMVQFQSCQKIGIWYKLLHEKVHMCGGNRFKGGVDSCGGDSGGPLTCKRKDGTYYLAGITSFGFSDCGQQGHVGIYARMLNFERWVTDTIHSKEVASKLVGNKYNGGYNFYSNYRTQTKG